MEEMLFGVSMLSLHDVVAITPGGQLEHPHVGVPCYSVGDVCYSHHSCAKSCRVWSHPRKKAGTPRTYPEALRGLNRSSAGCSWFTFTLRSATRLACTFCQDHRFCRRQQRLPWHPAATKDPPQSPQPPTYDNLAVPLAVGCDVRCSSIFPRATGALSIASLCQVA